MPDLFKGLNKMSDEDIRLQISLFQSINIGNAVKETSYRAVGGLVGLANMFTAKTDGSAGIFKFQEKGIEDVVVENVKKLKEMQRPELDEMLRNILIEKCNLLSMGAVDDASGDEMISVLIIRETAKVYSLNIYMPPAALAESISRKYYEQFLNRLHKELVKESPEEARITDNNLQQSLNRVSIEAKRDLSRKIVINEFSGRGIGRLIRTEAGIRNLTAVVECVGMEPFNILRTVIMSVYDAVLGINRISRAILAQLVWVAVNANGGKISVNTDKLPGFIQADQRAIRDEEEKIFLQKLSNRKELDKKVSEGDSEVNKFNTKLNELLGKLKNENDEYNESKSMFQELESKREQYNDNSIKTKDEIKKYYSDVVSAKRKYDNAEIVLKKRLTQVKELKLKLEQKETELAENRKEHFIADQTINRLAKEKGSRLEKSWREFFARLNFAPEIFEKLVTEFTDAEILKIEEYLKEMHDSNDIDAFSVKTVIDEIIPEEAGSEPESISDQNGSEITDNDVQTTVLDSGSAVSSDRVTKKAICMTANSKNAEITYSGRHIKMICKQ